MSIFYLFRKTAAGNFLSSLRSFRRNFFINYRKRLGYCHPSATITKPMIIKGAENVYLFEDTKICSAIIMTPQQSFIMKKHSHAAEGLTVITGNHERRVGRWFCSITQAEKKQGLDADVVVEEDCWIGVNVTLMMGVTVRRGTTVAAGAVVTKSTAPYSIVGGVPAKHLKFYWTIDQILEHEKTLYPEDERLSREDLDAYFSAYPK